MKLKELHEMVTAASVSGGAVAGYRKPLFTKKHSDKPLFFMRDLLSKKNAKLKRKKIKIAKDKDTQQ